MQFRLLRQPRSLPWKGTHQPRKLNSAFRLNAAAKRMECIDVAIAGGGPAGLAAAAAIRAACPELLVKVFEKTNMTARGAAVLVGVNGLKALRAIDPSLLQNMQGRSIQLQKSFG